MFFSGKIIKININNLSEKVNKHNEYDRFFSYLGEYHGKIYQNFTYFFDFSSDSIAFICSVF